MHILEAALAAQIPKRPELAPLAAGRTDAGILRLGGAFATVALLVLVLDGAAAERSLHHPESDAADRVR